MACFIPIIQGLRLLVALSSVLCGFQSHCRYHHPDKVTVEKNGRIEPEISSCKSEEEVTPILSVHLYHMATHLAAREAVRNSNPKWTATFSTISLLWQRRNSFYMYFKSLDRWQDRTLGVWGPQVQLHSIPPTSMFLLFERKTISCC
jgi:hypothetical protein